MNIAAVTVAGNDHEELVIDGEIWRLNLHYRHRIGDDWTVSIDVPWYRHSAGFLDDAVDAWHGLTNLPDGNRNLRGEDELPYLYKVDDQRRYVFAAHHGLGGIWRVRCGLAAAAACRFQRPA